ncbi:hypothetical protein D3Z30_13545 [Staphylococcus warneri]|uniref:Uncharacterized protein n=1 Tax=Staphylococcus warneri TaxID=1292 RepID=A0AB36BIU2_STAWA|nr:hypothetical protein [Staphylococcus warneri]
MDGSGDTGEGKGDELTTGADPVRPCGRREIKSRSAPTLIGSDGGGGVGEAGETETCSLISDFWGMEMGLGAGRVKTSICPWIREFDKTVLL